METKDLILIIAVFAILGFSIYKKYIKKSQDSTYGVKPPHQDSPLNMNPRDDDYEPYSGKQDQS